MTLRSSLNALTAFLRSRSTWDSKLATVVAFLITVGSALRVSFRLGYNFGVFHFSGFDHITCCVGFLESHLIPIVGGLLISTIGFWLRSSVGFLLSFLSLLWIGAIHVLWYLGTLSTMRMAGVAHFSDLVGENQRLLTLSGATWWDVLVLASGLLLFSWQVKKLIQFLQLPSNHAPLTRHGAI